MIDAKFKTPEEKKSLPFPKLMKSGNLIVFFTEFGCGTALTKDNMNYVGLVSSDAWNMEVFTDYNEPITIQNAI